jgi:hypothetical protein
MGYPYADAMSMPTWLFWAYVDANAKDRIVERFDRYAAGIAADSSIKPMARQSQVDAWTVALNTPIREVRDRSSNRPAQIKPRTFEELVAQWG